MSRKRVAVTTAVVLAALMTAGVAVVIHNAFFRPNTITAFITTATGIYPGDDVRVSGVKIGTVKSIAPAGAQARLTLNVDRDVPIPADAKAVIVAQNLVSARYVQLAPGYETGPRMRDGAVIPIERTAVPVEWDQVKTQLMRLATDLGPRSDVSGTSMGRFIDSAANAMDGNGDKLRQMLTQLSGVGRILANGSGNIADIIKNLQTFVTALRDSKVQIVQFQDRLATLSSVLDESRSSLDAALTSLSQAVGEIQRFIAGTRDKTSEQIQRLANVTQNLVDHRKDLEQVLHVAPTAAANAYAMYNPDTGTVSGSFVVNNFRNPLQLICSAIGSIENVTAAETGKLCAEYLAPALRYVNPLSILNFNYLPIPVDPFLQKAPGPGNLIYSEARLAPGGEGPKPGPPETPPAVSAYTGLPGDPVGPPGAVPPGRIPGAAMPLPPAPSTPPPSPPAPAPAPANLQDMLLPPGGPQP